eukprot:SAG11_NODE_133_length_15400_cov_10.132344_10_plen_85_part_00
MLVIALIIGAHYLWYWRAYWRQPRAYACQPCARGRDDGATAERRRRLSGGSSAPALGQGLLVAPDGVGAQTRVSDSNPARSTPF